MSLSIPKDDRLNQPTPHAVFCNNFHFCWGSSDSTNQISQSNSGQRLGSLVVGDTVGLMLTDTNCLKLLINGIEEEVLYWSYPCGQPVYAIFDLYGQCQQNLAKRKDPETKLTLPLPSTSTNSNSSIKMSPNNSPMKSCPYQEECNRFKNKMLLPAHYFNGDESICYCQNCYRSKCQESEKDNYLLGKMLIKFPMKNMTNVSKDKWHNSFYSSKLGAVRCILDKGQPLTKDFGIILSQGVIHYVNLLTS
ncbi:hypothetical protein NQ317_003243 [Molorchus minor]|uniref:NHR domain-containing protein n=1 Tax=Molorchus minor TaxID=1323400 RepID=A0ABQ9J7I1_9CUCU|nr:hypothetical protein NQ317_003243 [Molorchus minor]